MKRLILSVVITILSASGCLAQDSITVDSKTPRWNILKNSEVIGCIGIGNSFAKDNNDKDEHYDGVFGLTGKIMVNTWLNKHLAISYGLQYCREGVGGTMVENNRYFYMQDRFHYIGVPVMITWKPFKKYDFSLGYGIRPDYLLDATEKYDDFDVPYNRNIKNYVNRFDYKLILDFSYVFEENYFVGLEIDMGMRPLGDTRFLHRSSNSKNFSTMLYFGFRVF